MLPAANRLTKRQDFQSILKNGRSGWARYFTIKYQVSDANQPARFGFIVSTKVSKLATRRNHIKRLLRENIRVSFLPKLKRNIQAVIIAKKEIIDKDYHQINQDLTYTFKKQYLI
ncbi:MAG: ribonuclease P protein component [Patescibacteria group bacterium]